MQSSQHSRGVKEPDRNTLKVYWYLLLQPKGVAGLRQVQRAMGFSSPNAAIFHLDKLRELQLVSRSREGEYRVIHRQRFGEMRLYVLLGHYIIPKHAIYALVMSCIMLLCTIGLYPFFSHPFFLALLPGFFAVIILWYETIIVWKRRPKFEKQ